MPTTESSEHQRIIIAVVGRPHRERLDWVLPLSMSSGPEYICYSTGRGSQLDRLGVYPIKIDSLSSGLISHGLSMSRSLPEAFLLAPSTESLAATYFDQDYEDLRRTFVDPPGFLYRDFSGGREKQLESEYMSIYVKRKSRHIQRVVARQTPPLRSDCEGLCNSACMIGCCLRKSQTSCNFIGNMSLAGREDCATLSDWENSLCCLRPAQKPPASTSRIGWISKY